MLALRGDNVHCNGSPSVDNAECTVKTIACRQHGKPSVNPHTLGFGVTIAKTKACVLGLR